MPAPNFRPHLVHLGPRHFRPQILLPTLNCKPQISTLAPPSKSQGVPLPGTEEVLKFVSIFNWYSNKHCFELRESTGFFVPLENCPPENAVLEGLKSSALCEVVPVENGDTFHRFLSFSFFPLLYLLCDNCDAFLRGLSGTGCWKCALTYKHISKQN